MARPDFIDAMGNWTDVVVDHLYDIDPRFACEATHQLDSINRQFPNALTTPSTAFVLQQIPTSPFFPGFNTPASRPPSALPPIFGTPKQISHNAWTPMRTGGATPNRGIQGDPNTPLPSIQPALCRCGVQAGRCACRSPRRRGTPFYSPYRRTSPSPFGCSTPIIRSSPWVAPQIPASTPVWQAATNTPSRLIQTMPGELPSHQQWTFPARELRWSPHPAPHPEIPPANFWMNNSGLRGPPVNEWQFPNTPVNASQAAQLTGGWPLPGAAPWWTHNVWPQNVRDLTSSPVQLAPCLIPNPADAQNPQFLWDLAESPYGAKGLTPQATVTLQAQFHKMATAPAVDSIYIAIHDGLAQRIWGSIIIRNATNKVSVWDILHGIYMYFQVPVTQQDLDYFHTLDQSNHTILLNAAHRRGSQTPGEIKRVDSLGDQRRFWGLWITNKGQEGWHLNLGLKGP